MAEKVDAYQKWLGIPPEDSASGGPNKYRLLDLELFEADRATIDGAAKRLMGALQKQLAGPDQAAVRKLLDEISDARRCLLLGDRKAAYDQKLRDSLEASRAAKTSELSEPPGSIDVPTVEPIDVEPLEEIAAAVPIPDEAVPEAMPLEDLEAVPEPELIDQADEAPEAEPIDETDEIDEPTALEQIDAQPEPRAAPKEAAGGIAAIQPVVATEAIAPAKPTASQSPVAPTPVAPTRVAPTQPMPKQAAPIPASTPPALSPKPAPQQQPIAATARPSAPAPVEKVAVAKVVEKVAQPVAKAAATAVAADPLGWEHGEHAANEGEIDGSFFSGMGLSSIRSGKTTTSVEAGAIAGGKTTGNTKNSKSATTKSNPKSPAGSKSAATAAQTEGTSTVKKAAKSGPQMWQIMTGVGVGVVVLILIVAAMSGGGSTDQTSKPAHPAAVKQEAPHYGPQTVTGPIDDRTTRSPVAGPVKVRVERHGDLMLVAVKINDQDVGKFLLDTGIRDIIIGNDVAERLKLPKLGAKSMNVPGGVQQVTKRQIKSLTMGSVRFDDSLILPPPTDDKWEAVAVDLKPWSDSIHVKIAGVIGCDIWSQTPFEINPSKNIVTFFKRGHFPFSDPQKAEFLTLLDHKPAVPAPSTQGSYLLLATGAPNDLMLKGSATRASSLNLFGQDISEPATVESKEGDGYFDAEDRQSGVVGAGILSHYILDFDFQYQKYMAVPIKK